MTKVTMLDTVLHPAPVDPEHEEQRTREHATRAAQGEPYDPKALDLFNFERGTYALRFDKDRVYELDEDTAAYFLSNRWAVKVPEDVKIKKGDLAEPFDVRQTTDEEAERIEREVLIPAQQRPVQTVRYINTGPNEVLKGDPHEGENVTVVDLGQGESAPPNDGTTLDVHDATTDSSVSF